MELLGQPLSIQNTDSRNWLVTSPSAVSTSGGETISFTVAVPRDGDLSIAEIQVKALRRAVELLTLAIPPAG